MSETRQVVRLVPLVLVVLLGSAAHVRADTADRVDRTFHEVPLVDRHNDLPRHYAERVKDRYGPKQSSVGREQAQAGAVHRVEVVATEQGGRAGWSLFVPVTLQGADAVRAVLEQLAVVHYVVQLYPDTFDLAFTAADILRIHRSGKIASLIGVEGGHSITTSLAVMRPLYAAGARYTTLTRSDNNDWADSSRGMDKNEMLRGAFGDEVIAHYAHFFRVEQGRFDRPATPWEGALL